MSLLLTGGKTCAQEKRQNRSIVRKEQTRYLKESHEFGIELPLTVEQALALDAKNGNIFWAEAISKELKNVIKDFTR